MKIQEPSSETIQEAIAGSLSNVDSIIGLIQPGIFNLAVRMLGNRDDAADATQEILLKVVTHLSSFRSDSAFTTWVFRVAKNHLLTASTKTRESPEVSLEGL
jgi:RNA polymerase sigma factor (sigma-70 family)